MLSLNKNTFRYPEFFCIILKEDLGQVFICKTTYRRILHFSLKTLTYTIYCSFIIFYVIQNLEKVKHNFCLCIAADTFINDMNFKMNMQCLKGVVDPYSKLF